MNSLLPSLYTPRNKIKLAGVGSQEFVGVDSLVHSPTPVAGSALLMASYIVHSAVILTAIFIITHCPCLIHNAHFLNKGIVFLFRNSWAGSQSVRVLMSLAEFGANGPFSVVTKGIAYFRDFIFLLTKMNSLLQSLGFDCELVVF